MLRIQTALAATLAAALAAPAAAQTATEIVVNIPAGRLEVLRGGERIAIYPVSVGLAAHATPTGEARVRRVVWNPTWTPPDAEWARDERPAAPGPNNPMGRVKIHLFRDYYVHGTPARNERLLGRPASHGCIRMRNADVMELARLILDAEGDPLGEEALARLESDPRRTREVALAGRVRVRIEYRLADAEAGAVTLHPDVYGRAPGRYAERVAADLRDRGADPAPALRHLASAPPPATSLALFEPPPLREVPPPARTARGALLALGMLR
jgi:murein L,D-transpeptidase YcbB/YkuD